MSDESLSNAEAIALAAVWASVHNLRFMVNRGLVSQNEVDEFHSSLLEGFQGGNAELAATLEVEIGPVFIELHQWAEKLWIGRGQTNPR